MKISEIYPNFYQAISYYMIQSNYNYSVPSDDATKLSFMIPLASHKLGFDYYELNSIKTGGLKFEMITSLGLKTIKKTPSKIIKHDLEIHEWISIIIETSQLHILSEEYQALKHGYTKTKVGCFGTFLVFTFLLIKLF